MGWHRLQRSQTSENGDFSRVFPIFQPLAPSQGMEQLRACSQGMDTPFPLGCGRKSLESAHPGAGAAPEELRDRFPSIPRRGEGEESEPSCASPSQPLPKTALGFPAGKSHGNLGNGPNISLGIPKIQDFGEQEFWELRDKASGLRFWGSFCKICPFPARIFFGISHFWELGSGEMGWDPSGAAAGMGVVGIAVAWPPLRQLRSFN